LGAGNEGEWEGKEKSKEWGKARGGRGKGIRRRIASIDGTIKHHPSQGPYAPHSISSSSIISPSRPPLQEYVPKASKHCSIIHDPSCISNGEEGGGYAVGGISRAPITTPNLPRRNQHIQTR